MDIGRRIVKAFYYGLMPKHLYDHFSLILPQSRLDFLTQFRANPAPNRYLASLIKHMQEVVDDGFIREIVNLAFTEFINCHLHNFESYHRALDEVLNEENVSKVDRAKTSIDFIRSKRKSKK